MSFLFTTEAFDAQEPEESSGGKNQYLTRKDFVLVLVGFVLILLCLIPLYITLKDQRDQHLCRQNFKAIFSAMSQYMASNDDSLPPAYVSNVDGTPYLQKNHVITWATLIEDYMGARTSFDCPAARDEEKVATVSMKSGAREMTTSYGMFLPYSAYPRNLIANLTDVALVSETTNGGARDSYDPFPFKSEGGKAAPYDGFGICFDDSNKGYKAGQLATRLAFYGTSKGVFDDAATQSRHRNGIFMLTMEGNVKTVTPSAAKVMKLGSDPQGLWTVPVQIRRR